MSDSSSVPDSDNAVLTDSNNLRISCNVSTQTPEMPRHAIADQSIPQSMVPIDQSQPSSSFVVLRVDNTKDLSNFEKEAKALDIPDVVVEFIRDSCTLTGKTDDPDGELGATNPGFVSSESLSRVPSKSSFIEYQCSETASHLGSVSRLNKYFDGSSGSDEGLLPIASQNHRMYRSMPRNVGKKYVLDEFKLHSQPSSPRLPRMNVTNDKDVVKSNLSLYPPGNGIGNGFVAPPSPNFGYRPLESETSAVYTIIKTYIDTNDVRGIHFLPSMVDSMKSTPRAKRKFEFVPTPLAIERKRRRLQCLTDACSLMFFLPGVLLAILTPVFIIPMFLYPISYFLYLALIFVASGALSACIIFFSGFIGNMVWYYDDKSKRLRLKIHCGTGPMRHFWGNGFYAWADAAPLKEKNEKEMII